MQPHNQGWAQGQEGLTQSLRAAGGDRTMHHSLGGAPPGRAWVPQDASRSSMQPWAVTAQSGLSQLSGAAFSTQGLEHS